MEVVKESTEVQEVVSEVEKVQSSNDNLILVDAKVLADAIQLIHRDYTLPIDTHNGLINAAIKSGKFKFD